LRGDSGSAVKNADFGISLASQAMGVRSFLPSGRTIGSSKRRDQLTAASFSRKKFRPPRLVGTEAIPGSAELSHAICAVLAVAFGFHLSHREHGIDPPEPAIKLAANRADFDFVAIANYDPIVFGRGGVDHLSQKQIHAAMICPIEKDGKPQTPSPLETNNSSESDEYVPPNIDHPPPG
jgi:hypothetical protein